MYVRILFTVAIVSLLAAGCTNDPTQSDEYSALQSELDQRNATIEEQSVQLESIESNLAALQSDYDGAVQDSADALTEASASLSAAEARAVESERALDEELNAPWPEELTAPFVEGCAEIPEEGLSLDQQVTLCTCMFDQLEESFSLVDFLMFSIASADPDAELNTFTGLPVGMDPRFVEGLLTAATECLFAVSA